MKMKRWKLSAIVLLISFSVCGQGLDRPKLVVGIVVDQMRWDYLYRYYDRYTQGGFKRLLREGFSCENCMIPYTPTNTGVGHASIYSGSVPALHGIMGNNWYSKSLKRVVYCTEDFNVQGTGSQSSAGQMSPRLLYSNTITDELRLATNFRSKTIAIALKDRGSILPGGHTANASYWFDNATGGWISSSFYMQQLPDWVTAFNNKKYPEQYLKQGWNTLYPLNSYPQSTEDKNAYEGMLPGEDQSFPHRTDSILSNRFETFRYMPAGNTYTFDMARAAIEGEQLGKNGVPDFLALSFSSTDYAGHRFGPNAIELEDMYLRFDRDLQQFLQYLDTRIGKGRYLMFLTADHGVAHNPVFLNEHRLAGGVYDINAARKEINDSLYSNFRTTGLIEHSINYQIYLNDSILKRAQLDKQAVKNYITGFLLRKQGVSHVVDLTRLQETTLPAELKSMLANGYQPSLSGDLQVIMKPQWYEGGRTGASHALWNPYDAHIPLLWYGWNIRAGSTNREVYMTDIAATLAALLHIQMPNACIGKVITEVKR